MQENPVQNRRFEKWRTPKRRNTALLLFGAMVILLASFAIDNSEIAGTREASTDNVPNKAALDEVSR